MGSGARLKRGVQQPTLGHSTTQHWQQWLGSRELSRDDMTETLGFGKDCFKADNMRSEAVKNVNEWRGLNTRESKNTARDKVHGAFNAHLKQLYGHSQIAKFFLKYPPAALDNLLEAWQRYMDSPEYRQQRECRALVKQGSGLVEPPPQHQTIVAHPILRRVTAALQT